MAEKIKAELWDKMHYLFRDFNDRMVHLELHYDYESDTVFLTTAYNKCDKKEKKRKQRKS